MHAETRHKQLTFRLKDQHANHQTIHCTKNCLYTMPLTYVKGVKGHIWPYLWSLLTRVKGHFWLESNVIHLWLKSNWFCPISLARAVKVHLLTFDLRQRDDNFDVCQSCVKANVKSAPTPLIRVSKIAVQLCLHFWCESKLVKAKFSWSDRALAWNCESMLWKVGYILACWVTCLIRAVTKGQGLGIYPSYYEHDLQLFSS